MTSPLAAIKKGNFELEVTDGKPKFIGVVILLITFGLFGTWAATAPIDGASLAPGQVTVKNYRKTLQHLEGGIVKSILVRDGDQVEKGQELLILDDTQYQAELGIIQGQIISITAARARLASERDGLESIVFPELFKESNDPRITDAKINEETLFEARKNSINGQINVLKQRISQINAQISGIKEIIESKKMLLSSFQEESKELKELLEEGFVDIQRIRDIDRRVAELKAELSDYRSSIAQSGVKLSETELQIIQLQKEFRTEVVNQLTQLESQLFDLKERERALEARVDRTIVKAPESGMVMALSIHTEGGVIRSGEPLLDIVPESSELIIEAQVSPIDIDRVHEGLLADIRFSAFKSATTPVIEGKVSQLSADRLVDPNNGAPYYLARIELTELGMEQLQNLVLVPGMPAEVLISTGERTLLQYLGQPVTDAFARSFIED